MTRWTDISGERYNYEQDYIKSCIVLAQCLILSVKVMTSDKIKVIHVNYFVKYVSDVCQILNSKPSESLDYKLNSELFNCLHDLFSVLLVKSQKSLAESQLQNQLKDILENQKSLVGALQLNSFVPPKEEVPVRIVAMRSHILQQPLNIMVEEFFQACVPTISLHDIAMKRQAIFRRVKSVGVENDTANLQIVYSNSNVAKLLSQIPELLSNSTQFKTGLQYLTKLATRSGKFSPLAQFYFLSARAAFMQGSTEKAIEYFQKALNVQGTHIGHHFTITANLLCAIQQYAFEVSNAQEALLVKESIQLKMSSSKAKMLTHFLRCDQRASLLSDISLEMANRLFQPKQNLNNQRLKRCAKEDLMEILKVNISHYVNASLFVCNCDLQVINSFVDSIRNAATIESRRQLRLA